MRWVLTRPHFAISTPPTTTRLVIVGMVFNRVARFASAAGLYNSCVQVRQLFGRLARLVIPVWNRGQCVRARFSSGGAHRPGMSHCVLSADPEDAEPSGQYRFPADTEGRLRSGRSRRGSSEGGI